MNSKLQLIQAFFFCPFFDLCSLQKWRPIQSEQTATTSVELDRRLPTSHSHHLMWLVCRDQSLQEIIQCGSRVFPSCASLFFPLLTHFAVSAQLTLSLACGMHIHGQPRGVRLPLLLRRVNLSHPLCTVWGLFLICSSLSSGCCKPRPVHTPLR